MRRTYRGLAKIEDSFKVTKTCFESRPVYARTNDHSDAHFATCFLALVLMRLLEYKLDYAFPVGQILASIESDIMFINKTLSEKNCTFPSASLQIACKLPGCISAKM